MGKRRKLIDTMFKLRLFDAVSLRAQLTVLTYHRIGEADGGYSFDHSVFGPTAEAFEDQMRWLAKFADPVSEADVLAALRGNFTLPRRAVLVTFDDAYRDQITIGVPILKSCGVPAVFFVTPGMIDNGSVGFWDHISHAVRLTTQKTLRINDRTFDLSNRSEAVSEITRWVKEQPGTKTFSLTEAITKLLKVAPAEKSDQASELMSWDDIADLARDQGRHGFSIGSHGLTHRLLARLSNEDQEYELRASKQRLEHMLGVTIRSVAYPAGSFSPETPKIARRLGYEAVFSFESGFNDRAHLNPEEIRRIPAGDTPALVACATSLPWALGASYYP